MKNFNDLKSWISYGQNSKIFDNHIAKVKRLPTGENDIYIHFESPTTSNGWMDFIYCNGVLTIQGDYGYSAFCWYNKRNTIEVLANFANNLGYFMSKLVSAESCNIGGTFFQDFDTDECIDDIETYFRENELTISEEWRDDYQRYATDNIEWITFCRENGEDFFQDEDYREYAYSFGRYTTNRAFIQAYGLIKAVEYINKKQRDKKR